MKALAVLLIGAVWLPLAAHADDTFSASQIALLQHRGWLTPKFQAAARDLIAAKESSSDLTTAQATLKAQQPALQQSVTAEDAQVAKLKADLARYDHPDETDFTALQDAMKSTTLQPSDQLALAQAYVWTYPASPHVTEATQDLQQLEKKIADQAQAASDAEAARLAAQAKLLQRVQAHDLDIGGWRAFLQDKTQAEVVQYLGNPTSKQDEYWIYSGAWTTDPETKQKAGLQLNFNGGRVLSVAPVPEP